MAGRPKAIIDWEKVGKLLQAGCSVIGIAEQLGIERDTLYKRCKADLKCDFSTFAQQKKAHGDDLLHAKQFELAMKGDRTMLVWLGKQRLNQSDKAQHEHTGKDGEALIPKIVVEVIHDRNAADNKDKD
jgi:hypothetical protein